MAKLRAYGRTELWRIEKTTINVPKDSRDSCKEVKRYAGMSDGHLLSNLVVYWPNGQVHNYGWKKVGKYGPNDLQHVKDTLINTVKATWRLSK